jgi:putative MATE family efflux protein
MSLASALFRKKEIQITEGKLLGNMIRYAIPIILTNILQLLYNSADMYVIGNFCDDPNAQGAIGCTGSLISLILGLFIGLGAGVCVTLSHSIGSKDNDKISKTIHTSVTLALVLGVIVSIVGFVLAPFLLTLMNTREEHIAGSTLYVQIYFMGAIPNIMYNFCAGIMRSRGDTVRPLIFSSVGGVVNVIMNLVFVVVFHMNVEGVAIATIASQTISSILSIIYLTRLDDACKLYFKKLRIDKATMIKFLKIGIPAGIQGSLFSLSNVLLQSGYNSLGTLFVNANAAANQVDGYLYNILNSFYHVVLTFASQNYGAKNTKRLKKVFILGVAIAVTVGLTLGILTYIFSDQLVGIFNSSTDILEVAKYRLLYVGLPYFLCGLMEIGTAMLRSIGYSLLSTIITFFGSCLFRIIWVTKIFPMYNTVASLYIVYPISWTVTFVSLTVAYVICYRHNKKKLLAAGVVFNN